MAETRRNEFEAVWNDSVDAAKATTATAAPTAEPRPSMDNYPELKYEFKREPHKALALSEEIARNNPLTRNIVRKVEIEIIRSLSDELYYFYETLQSGDRRIPESMWESAFETIVKLGDRVIELTPILTDGNLLIYFFEREGELAVNLRENINLFRVILNRRLVWGAHPVEMELYLYGVSAICQNLSNMFNRYFDKYETKSNIEAIETAVRACEKFMEEADPGSLDDAQALITESKSLEERLRSLFKTFANHSQGEKAAKVVREMEEARRDSFNFYTNSGYASEIKEYVLTALMYTGMEFKSLTRGGSQYPWVIQFTWPRDPETRKKVYTIEMSNSTKDFHFPFCVDHQNHTLIDAILVHLTQDGVNQDAVVL